MHLCIWPNLTERAADVYTSWRDVSLHVPGTYTLHIASTLIWMSEALAKCQPGILDPCRDPAIVNLDREVCFVGGRRSNPLNVHFLNSLVQALLEMINISEAIDMPYDDTTTDESTIVNTPWDNGDFVSTWVTWAVHGGCRRMACHKAMYWHRLSSTCTSMIYQQQLAGNVLIPTISALPTKHEILKISTPPSTLTLLRSANFVNAGACSIAWQKQCRALCTCTML